MFEEHANPMASLPRMSTGVPGLDEHLGGGLLGGTMTVVVGSTGVGKTQLGLQFAQAGADQEGQRGVLFDLSCRGDSQSHQEYAARMFDWKLSDWDTSRPVPLANFFEATATLGDYLHVFDYRGRRPVAKDLDFDGWHAWQAELVTKLQATVAFLYGALVRGVRRVVIDGVDPADRQAESMQK